MISFCEDIIDSNECKTKSENSRTLNEFVNKTKTISQHSDIFDFRASPSFYIYNHNHNTNCNRRMNPRNKDDDDVSKAENSKKDYIVTLSIASQSPSQVPEGVSSVGNEKSPSMVQQTIECAYRYFSMVDDSMRSEALVQNIENKLISLIGGLSTKDLGLSSGTAFDYDLSYYDIFDSYLFTCGMFVLKKGSFLPLHNHPNMTVFTKVLRGKAYCRSMDIVRKGNGSSVIASMTGHVSYAPDSPVYIVRPTSGNIHSIYAEEDCVFLDIIGPPYGEHAKCTYYQDSESVDGTFILSEIFPHLHIEDLPYVGDSVDASFMMGSS